MKSVLSLMGVADVLKELLGELEWSRETGYFQFFFATAKASGVARPEEFWRIN